MGLFWWLTLPHIDHTFRVLTNILLLCILASVNTQQRKGVRHEEFLFEFAEARLDHLFQYRRHRRQPGGRRRGDQRPARRLQSGHVPGDLNVDRQ